MVMTDRIAFSNSVRLSGAQWLGLAAVATAFVLVAPWAWTRFETFTPEPDYRIPHELSEDYWLFERYAALAVEEYDVVILGDSVVWGEYVLPDETLSHYLNEAVATAARPS